MAFYENTIVAKQDLAEKDLKTLKDKYNELINKSSGKVIKIALSLDGSGSPRQSFTLPVSFGAM